MSKLFPLQTQRGALPGPVQIPWSVAEIAYGKYVSLYGKGQSLERLAERGGFGWAEMDELNPGWREQVSEIANLRIALEESLKLQAHYATLLNQSDGGSRWIFNTPEEWMNRLREIGTIK